MVERFGEYILEQSVSVRVVPELDIEEGGCRICRQNFVPFGHISVQTMFQCIS